MVIPGTSL